MQTLMVREHEKILYVTLDRPDVRNAMSQLMVSELRHVFQEVAGLPELRAVVLRGAGEHFCSGGDIADIAEARQQLGGKGDNPFYRLSRNFGRLLTEVRAAPLVVVAVVEGAVMGGGLGLAAVADITLARRDARFGLPETSLGVIPAQIAPFLIERMGLAVTRRMALTGMRIDGEEALRIGLVHALADSSDELDALLEKNLADVRRCAPNATRETKRLLLASRETSLSDLLDRSAERFAAACMDEEALEGSVAFLEKRPPNWVR